MSTNNWQILCEAVRYFTGNSHHRYRSEEDFEDHFYEYLKHIFHWPPTKVLRQQPVQFGHEHKRLDLVIIHDNHPSLVFELKWNVSIDSESLGQLFSYMVQLETEFGIITNGSILQLYYKPLGKRGDPKRLFNIHYDATDPDGIKLGELLDYDHYSETKLKNFCEDLLLHQKDQNQTMYQFTPDLPNPFMAQQMSQALDDKILHMITLYQTWLTDNPREAQYIAERNAAVQWVKANVLNIAKLKTLNDSQYIDLIHEIPSHLINLKYGPSRTLYRWLPGTRATFTNAIKHLDTVSKEQRFSVIDDLLDDPSYKIKGMSQSFWSEIIRCKFDDVPLVNNKTDDFFTALGLNIGTSPDAKLRNVYYCYSRWRKLSGNQIDMNGLSHLEHFAKVSKVGKKFMLDNFHALVGEIS